MGTIRKQFEKAVNTLFGLQFNLKGNRAAWKIFTHLTQQERIWLYRLALVRRPKVVVEIGSYLGASSSFLVAALSDLKNGAHLYCVDTWQNEGMSEGIRDTFLEFTLNMKNYASFYTPLRGNSSDLAADFRKNIDLIFLDGDHSYEGCKMDVDRWFPKLRRGGLLIMHDIAWAEGVQMVVEELLSGGNIEQQVQFYNLFWATRS